MRHTSMSLTKPDDTKGGDIRQTSKGYVFTSTVFEVKPLGKIWDVFAQIEPFRRASRVGNSKTVIKVVRNTTGALPTKT